MITYEDLHQQNHKITELSNALHLLLGDQSLCESEITRDLFFEYVEQVKGHLEKTDKNLYTQLLTHHEQKVRNTADRFLGGSKEIKRLFAAYLKRWCQMKSKSLAVKEHDLFIKETEEMFEMVLNRLQDETEHLYPLIRNVTGDNHHAVAVA